MSFKETIGFYLRGSRGLKKYLDSQEDEKSKLNHIAAELIRNTHSIEKGLSIEHPRLGFGHKKQEEMMTEIEVLQKSNSSYHKEACEMALDAIGAYLEYHDRLGYSDDACERLRAFLHKNEDNLPHERKGGTLTLHKESLAFDIPAIEYFFNTRHSIRDFDKTEIDDTKLRKALELAQRAPSACNRQGVRAYVLGKEKSAELVAQLSGIGGFAEAVNKYILITGKTSSYRLEENNQYIVSASMYAAYLTLTLHLYGMGSCVVQRPVIWTEWWEQMQKSFQIEKDEQVICLLAVGNLKDTCTVPLSHRLQNSDIIRFL